MSESAPAGDREELVSHAVDEYFQLQDLGQAPGIHEFAERFPEVADELNRLLPALAVVRSELGSSKAAHQDCFQSDLELADYQLVREIGRGGMGTVYLALQVSTGRLVALKVLDTSLSEGSDNYERFRVEAQILARLKHDNIVPVYEVGKEGECAFYSMEYCQGGSLADRLHCRRLNVLEATELVEIISRAVHCSHLAGVVHRDLKPSNILLQVRSENATADLNEIEIEDAAGILAQCELKLADFGLAKHDDRGYLTITGIMLGTPHYMSPEQVTGEGVVGVATDVHALGILLFECLLGHPPFKGKNIWESIRQVATRDPIPLRQLHRDIPRDLEVICLKCLQKDPHQRYPTAFALAEDLRKFRFGLPISIRPVGALKTCWLLAKRYPAMAALVFLVFNMAIGGPLVSIWAVHSKNLAIQESRRSSQQIGVTKLLQSLIDGEQQGAEVAVEELHAGLQSAIEARDSELEKSIRLQLAAWQLALPSWRIATEQSCLFCIARSRDGQLVASAGRNQSVVIWSVDQRVLVRSPLQHPGIVYSLAFSPDGETILTGCGDSAARLWGVRSGQVKTLLIGHDDRVLSVAFSPDGQTIATGSDDGTVKTWDAKSGHALNTIQHGAVVRCVSFSPDGAILASGGDDGKARFWHTSTGRETGIVFSGERRIFTISFSPDGDKVAVGDSQAARCWSVVTAEQLLTLKHQGWVMAAQFSPSGQAIMTASTDGTVAMWDLHGKLLGRCFEHPDQVRSAVFSLDGRSVLTGCWDGMVRCWQSHEPSSQPSIGFLTADMSNDRKTMAVADWGPDVRLLDCQSQPQFLPQRLILEHGVRAVDCSHDGSLVILADEADSVRIWNTVTNDQVVVPTQNSVTSVAISPDGSTALTCNLSQPMQLWNVASGLPLPITLKNTEEVLDAEFSHDGQLILTGDKKYQVRLWSATTGELKFPPFFHRMQVNSVAFGRNSQVLATGSEDRTVQLWECSSGKPLCRPILHPDSVLAVAINPDGTICCTGCRDSFVRLWEVRTGYRLGPALRSTGPVRFVSFTRNGTNIISGSDDGLCQWAVPAALETAEGRLR